MSSSASGSAASEGAPDPVAILPGSTPLDLPAMNPLRARPMETAKHMMTLHNYVCPRCDHLLVPVHAVEGARRRVIALTCPEPYCDHVQCLPRDLAAEIEEQEEPSFLRRAN